MRKRHLAFAAFSVLLLGLVSCNNAPESGTAVIVADQINDNSPVESDVSTGGIIYEDLVPVTFESRAFSQYITAPRGNAIVESYTVSWTRTDGGSGTLPSHTEETNIFVPVDDSTPGTIRLVTWADKTNPLLSSLVGTTNQVTMRATIAFTAREEGTEKDIKFQAAVSVHFADTQ